MWAKGKGRSLDGVRMNRGWTAQTNRRLWLAILCAACGEGRLLDKDTGGRRSGRRQANTTRTVVTSAFSRGTFSAQRCITLSEGLQGSSNGFPLHGRSLWQEGHTWFKAEATVR